VEEYEVEFILIKEKSQPIFSEVKVSTEEILTV